MADSSLVRNLRDQIVERVRDDIVTGRLAAGEDVREVELAKRFGVSRGPIREALQLLAAEGTLVARPNCGMRVPEPADAETRKLFQSLRCSIEVYALRRALPDLTDLDFAWWRECLERVEQACRVNDIAVMQREEFGFHRYLVARVGDADVLRAWLSVTSRLWHGMPPLSRETLSNPMRFYEAHAQLLEAIATREPGTAIAALEAHIKV